MISPQHRRARRSYIRNKNALDILLVFLAQPAHHLFFSALSASSAVNKNRSEKLINNREYMHQVVVF
jgi:hypothetical protein